MIEGIELNIYLDNDTVSLIEYFEPKEPFRFLILAS